MKYKVKKTSASTLNDPVQKHTKLFALFYLEMFIPAQQI